MLEGHGLLIGNMKGGVGKSTISHYLYEILSIGRKPENMLLIDADTQGSSSSMLAPRHGWDRIRHMPVGDRYDGSVISTLDGMLRNHLINCDTLALIDTPGGQIANLWKIAMICRVIIIPTSLSGTDLRSTLEFINDLVQRKQDYDTFSPHILVVPNRIPPNQRDYSILDEVFRDLDIILAPPLSEMAIVRTASHSNKGLADIVGTRYYDEIKTLARFINSHVLSGKLDRMYGPATSN